MTDGQFDEVHEISKRLDRIIAAGKWFSGIALLVIIPAAAALIDARDRITSLETSRDATAETIRRIDRNVDEMTRYLREGRP